MDNISHASLVLIGCGLGFTTIYLAKDKLKLHNRATCLALFLIDKYIDLKWKIIGHAGTEQLNTTHECICKPIRSTIDCSIKHIMYTVSDAAAVYLHFNNTLPKLSCQDLDYIDNIIIYNNGTCQRNTNMILTKYIAMCIGPNGSAPLPTITELCSIRELTDILYGTNMIIVNMSETLRELVIKNDSD